MSAALASPVDEVREFMRERGLFVRELSLRASSIDEKERSFEAVVATEQRVAIIDWQRYEVIDEILVARGGQFPEQVPLLPNHRRYDVLDVIGSAKSFRREGDKWVGRGIVAEPANERDDVAVIWKRVAAGHIRAVSIGYQVLNSVDIPPGKRASVDGKQYQAGERLLRISTEWRVHELSLTPIGADSMALIRTQLGDAARTKRRFFR